MVSSFRIDRASAIPVYVQLGEQIRLLVHRGVLKRGDPMPTVRELAVELGINANTVTRVYRDLQTEGLLRLERGIGTFVEGASDAPTLGQKDFDRIARRARELVALCRKAGLSSRELGALIEGTWKEKPDEG
jgi:DNA-binding transcriptional regulator YhcF (GntR family)